MSLNRCYKCGEELAEKARVCPHCGRYTHGNIVSKYVIRLFQLIAIVLLILGVTSVIDVISSKNGSINDGIAFLIMGGILLFGGRLKWHK